MRLLVFSPWFPHPPDNGSRLRAWGLIERLARVHELHLVTGMQDDSPERIPDPVAAVCRSVCALPWRWHRPGATGAAGALRALLSPIPRDILERPHPELVRALSERARSADAVLALELAADAYLPESGPPLVLDQIELSGVARARPLTRLKAQAYWRRRLRRYAAVTVVSDAEAEAARRICEPDRPPVHVVPNAVTVCAAGPPERAPVSGRMLFAGGLGYPPNGEALLWFADAVLPQVAARVPEAHVVVTGRCDGGPAALLQNPRVRLTGWLPDLRDTYAQAALAVVPLRSGGGTRLKTIEAWAAGVPVAATGIGVAGLDVRDGVEALVADGADALADVCVALLTDPDRARRVGHAGWARAVSRHDADAAAAALDTLLRQAVDA